MTSSDNSEAVSLISVSFRPTKPTTFSRRGTSRRIAKVFAGAIVGAARAGGMTTAAARIRG
jgi:hypothetical protein